MMGGILAKYLDFIHLAFTVITYRKNGGVVALQNLIVIWVQHLARVANLPEIRPVLGSNKNICLVTQVQNLVYWSNRNNLSLNVPKTKKMVIDFRTNKNIIQTLSIQGTDVNIVNSFRFLGTRIKNKLTWYNHCQINLRKARQSLYFLRKLKSIQVKKHVLTNFYSAIIDSILTFSITIWYDRAS